LKDLVGAGRFERPPPCAQGGAKSHAEFAYFQRISFQADGMNSLSLVELFGIRGISHPHYYLQPRRNLNENLPNRFANRACMDISVDPLLRTGSEEKRCPP
jgi:hypothetical protein